MDEDRLRRRRERDRAKRAAETEKRGCVREERLTELAIAKV